MKEMKRPTSFPSTDSSLLQDLRDAQNDSAWRNFDRLYSRAIYHFCRKRGMQPADAEEVTNDVLQRLSIWIGRFRYDRARGKFRQYLATIIRQVASRHKCLSTAALPKDWEPHQQAWLDEVLISNTLHLAREMVIAEVDEVKWQAFVMSYDEHLDDQTIAQNLNRKIGWVYKAKHQVNQRLKHWVTYFSEDAGLPEF